MIDSSIDDLSKFSRDFVYRKYKLHRCSMIDENIILIDRVRPPQAIDGILQHYTLHYCLEVGFLVFHPYVNKSRCKISIIPIVVFVQRILFARNTINSGVASTSTVH